MINEPIDYCINNVSEFLKIIDDLSSNIEETLTHEMLFRGESLDYHNNKPKFISSAFRSTPISGYETSEELPFRANVNSFKQEVFGEVDSDIKNNFLAYAQHHGIKTNLIDVTTNPLVALYFSAENNRDEDGYVYIIKSPILNITYLFDLNIQDNLLDIIISNNENITIKLIKKFHGFGIENTYYIETYFYTLFQQYYREVYKDKNFTINKENKNEEIVAEVLNRIIMKEPSYIIANKFEGYNTNHQKGFFYLILLRESIRLKKRVYSYRDNRLRGLIPVIYKPAMSFKRGINQSGLFLYQSYILSEGNALLTWQDIVPNHTIKVKNKLSILKELDMININKKFIYGDHSSIAKYIEEKHENKKRIMKKISDQL